jgi:DNA-binding PadR family transcriptional regulator
MTAPTRDPEQHLPLTPALFHVLVALADGDKHGYAILKDVTQRTAGKVVLGTGTLYGIIKRLLDEGWIEEVRRRPAGDDARRRYYRLTPFGRQVALAEARRLESVVAAARDVRLLARARA